MKKFKRLGISLEASVLGEVEKRRGLVSRSTYINAALKRFLDGGGDLNASRT